MAWSLDAARARLAPHDKLGTSPVAPGEQFRKEGNDYVIGDGKTLWRIAPYIFKTRIEKWFITNGADDTVVERRRLNEAKAYVQRQRGIEDVEEDEDT